MARRRWADRALDALLWIAVLACFASAYEACSHFDWKGFTHGRVT